MPAQRQCVTPLLWRRRKRIVVAASFFSYEIFFVRSLGAITNIKGRKTMGIKGKLGLDDAQTKDFARSTIQGLNSIGY